MIRSFRRLDLAAAVVFVVPLVNLAGCGYRSNGLVTVATTGKVTYQGEAVEGATIVFIGEETEKTATAMTDASGRFSLQTANVAGAMTGHYRVTIDKTAAPTENEARVSMDDVVAGKPQAVPKQLLPIKYSDPIQTPLRCEVARNATNHFEWTLTD